MWRIISVKALPGYRLDIEFEDGTCGVLDYSQELWGPLFEPLKDPQRFAEVGLDEFGVVCWPNGADLAPDAMYDQIQNGTTVSR